MGVPRRAQSFICSAWCCSSACGSPLDLRLTGWAFGGVPASQLVSRAAPWSLVGAIVTVVSGMALYSADAARMASNPVFQFKVAALALALANAWLFHAVLSRRMRDWDTAAAPPRAVQASAYVSLALWASSWSPASSSRSLRP